MTVAKTASASMYTAILVSAIAIWWAVLTLIEERSAPIVLHSVVFSSATAKPNDTLWLKAKITRHRYCPGVVYEFWRHNEHVIQGNIRPASPSKRLGSAVINLQKKVPAEVTPGRWCYSPLLVYDCKDRQHVITSPPACLKVTS